MKQKSIAIDVDDVLADHAEAFIVFTNQNYGTNIILEDYSDDWRNIWTDVDDDEVYRRAMEFLTIESVYNFEPKEGALEVLKGLSKTSELFIVTARPSHLTEVTIKWVEKYFSGIFKGVHMVPIWEPNNTVTKADICNQIGAKHLIDDNVEHCNIAHDGGMQSIVFGNYIWNRSLDINDGVVKCSNWQDIAEYFNLHK
jgi:5'(3')-deoxyribonucleotidase